MHVLPSTAQLPRNKSKTGNIRLVSGSTLLVEEAKQNKPQGSHKREFRSSHAEEPPAKQCDQPWSQVHLFYDASMMVCRTPQPQKCPLTLWFSSGAIALAFWDVWLPAGRTSSMEQAVRQCWATEFWRFCIKDLEIGRKKSSVCGLVWNADPQLSALWISAFYSKKCPFQYLLGTARLVGRDDIFY